MSLSRISNESQPHEDTKIFDVAIVGAGPAGSTTAYYAATYGLDVLILEKEKFPRNKVCGDAITLRAQRHLEKMGVMKRALQEVNAHEAAMGGLVSPSGI